MLINELLFQFALTFLTVLAMAYGGALIAPAIGGYYGGYAAAPIAYGGYAAAPVAYGGLGYYGAGLAAPVYGGYYGGAYGGYGLGYGGYLLKK